MREICGARGECAESHTCPNQRTRFHAVHGLQFVHSQRLSYRLQVNRLTAGHAERSTGLCQHLNHCDALGRAQRCVVILGQHFEGKGLQCIANEQGRCFVIGLVYGCFAAAKIIVIHGWHVVVYQRVGVNQLHRARRPIQAFVTDAKCLRGRVDQ